MASKLYLFVLLHMMTKYTMSPKWWYIYVCIWWLNVRGILNDVSILTYNEEMYNVSEMVYICLHMMSKCTIALEWYVCLHIMTKCTIAPEWYVCLHIMSNCTMAPKWSVGLHMMSGCTTAPKWYMYVYIWWANVWWFLNGIFMSTYDEWMYDVS